MKTAIALLIALGASAASARTYTTQMTCAEARNLVEANGAVVLYERPHIYDRYVAHQGFCMYGEVTRPAWIQTADDNQCFVGYVCRQDDRGD